MSEIQYRQVIGSLLYAAVITRPDIINSVRTVSKYMQNPGMEHWKSCKRILQYLKLRGMLTVIMDPTSIKEDQFLDIYFSTGTHQFLGHPKPKARLLSQVQRRNIWPYLRDYERPIFQDNQSTIKLANNSILHKRTKHIDIRAHAIRDHIEKGTIILEFVTSSNQLADSLTKAVPKSSKYFYCSLPFSSTSL